MASNRKKEKNLVKRARQRREKTLAEKASQDAEALQKALRLDAGASPSEKDSLNIDYTITRDPLPDPWFDSLPTEDREDLEHAHEIITSNRRKAVALFEKLAAKYPDNPSIYNNLMAARGTANAGALTEAIERFPDYLFAKTNFAHYLLREKRATEVPAVFGNKLKLNELYPDRSVFHISEHLAFWAVLSLYFLEVGYYSLASKFWEKISELDDDLAFNIGLLQKLSFHPLVGLTLNALANRGSQSELEDNGAAAETNTRNSQFGHSHAELN